METGKMARFISELRKAKNLTQKELAEKLGVTDKAVSKWERGLSCPDIALLSPLSEILGVTTSELLQDERALPVEEGSPAPPDGLKAYVPLVKKFDKFFMNFIFGGLILLSKRRFQSVEALVEATLDYADTTSKNKLQDLRKTLMVILSASFLLGNMVCVICNVAINGTLTWAWFTISASIYLWLVVMPALLWRKRGGVIALIVFSVLVIPFLFALEKTIGIPNLIMPMGTHIAVISLCYIWFIAVLYAKTKLNPLIKTALVLLIGIPVSVWINGVVADYTGHVGTDVWDIIGYFIMLILSLSLFTRYYSKKRTRKDTLTQQKI